MFIILATATAIGSGILAGLKSIDETFTGNYNAVNRGKPLGLVENPFE